MDNTISTEKICSLILIIGLIIQIVLGMVNLLLATENTKSLATYVVGLFRKSINCWGKMISVFIYVLILPILFPGVVILIIIGIVKLGFCNPQKAFEPLKHLFGF